MNLKPKEVKNFNAMPVPIGYVAGRGRGATGFTTRSDIGPAKTDGDAEERGGGGGGGGGGGDDENKEFDDFMGADAGIFSTAHSVYDDDDKQADAIWEAVDKHIDQRRRDRREARIKEQIEKHRLENPKIIDQFADLKRKLADVSKEEWESIPEPGDHAHKRQKRFDQFAPVPDSMLTSAMQKGAMNSSISVGGEGGGGESVADLTNVGSGRKKVLSLKLDKMADSVTGQTVIDPKGYATDLANLKVMDSNDISDIKRVRHLMNSIIKTNPNHAPGWIAKARLEEMAGKLSEALTLIRTACEQCPHSVDVWLEAVRLHPPDQAKVLLAQAVSHNPYSPKLWLQGIQLEADRKAKSRVARKALEHLPQNPDLWKKAVDLEDEDNAKILLGRAVECCPQEVDLWLALSKLESYANAKQVLNNARKSCPQDGRIWITGAQLEELNGNKERVGVVISKGIQSLKANYVVIEREWWLQQAEIAEKQDPPTIVTCTEIVKAVAGVGVEDIDAKNTLMTDAADYLSRGSPHTARALYHYALERFPAKKSLWRALIGLEKSHGTPASLAAALSDSVRACPSSEVLWLMAAKEKWLAGDVQGARDVLEEAFVVISGSEEVWLAAFKLEYEIGEIERSRRLLGKARQVVESGRVFMKSAIVERQLGNDEEELSFIEQGLTRFPATPKLWLMKAQYYSRHHDTPSARAAYVSGLTHCPDSIPLRVGAAKLEEAAGHVARARSHLEQGRIKAPQSEDIWVESVKFEVRQGQTRAGEGLMARGLQEGNCPKSGRLWALRMAMAPKPTRKRVATDALSSVGHNREVFAAMGVLFWGERKVETARKYFERAVALGGGWGDVFAMWYRMECEVEAGGGGGEGWRRWWRGVSRRG